MPETLKLWRNARLATCDAALGVIGRGALVTRGGRIEWVGSEAALPATLIASAAAGAAPEEHDLGGAWVTPGLIDCHTHLVFAGDRSQEFEQRRAQDTLLWGVQEARGSTALQREADLGLREAGRLALFG